jgi:hypothetical protein
MYKLNFVGTWLAEITGTDPNLNIGYFQQFVSFDHMHNNVSCNERNLLNFGHPKYNKHVPKKLIFF